MRFLFNLIEVITGWASPCVHGVNSLSLIGITVIGTEVVDTISDIAYVHVSKGGRRPGDSILDCFTGCAFSVRASSIT
jgi:hypothetical protein